MSPQLKSVVGFGAPASAVALCLLATVLLAHNPACSSGTGDESPSPCTRIQIAENGQFPGADFQFAYIGNPVIVDLSLPAAADAAITVQEKGSGADVMGTNLLSEDGRRLIFTPDERLMTTTEYTATVNASELNGCNDLEVSWDFRTSDVGEAHASPQDLVGDTFGLDLGSAVFIEPAGIGAFIGEFLGFPIFLNVQSLDDPNDEIVFAGSIGEEAGSDQDMCTQTLVFPAASWDNPDFSFGPTDFNIRVKDVDVSLQDLFITGTFRSDGSEIVGAQLSGGLDTRALTAVLGDQGDPCELLATIAGVECLPCPDGEVACIDLVAINVNGARENFDWVDIGEDQTENHLCGDCADSLDGDGDGAIDTDPECDPSNWP
jgi:hypothetical protein